MFNTKFILRFDDITPGMAWSKFLPLKKELESLGVKSVLGVVPESLDESLNVEQVETNFFKYICLWQNYGDAILQHGTHHVYKTKNSGILKINNSSEFAGCSYEEQYNLIKKGKEILQKNDCWQPYFMAPSHSFDKNTLKALTNLDFISISDGYSFFPYKINEILFVPQLFSSPKKYIPGICTLCIHINNMSDKDVERLIYFIKRNKDSFLDFKMVSEEKSFLKNNFLLRNLIGLIIKVSRFIRK
jgi:predicted deacetylase